LPLPQGRVLYIARMALGRDNRQGMIDTKKAGEALCFTRLFEIL